MDKKMVMPIYISKDVGRGMTGPCFQLVYAEVENSNGERIQLNIDKGKHFCSNDEVEEYLADIMGRNIEDIKIIED